MSRLYSTPARPITLLTSTWWGVPTFSFVPALGSRWLWRMACLASPGKTTAQAVHIGGGGGRGRRWTSTSMPFPSASTTWCLASSGSAHSGPSSGTSRGTPWCSPATAGGYCGAVSTPRWGRRPWL
jgi:hypothetical protein